MPGWFTPAVIILALVSLALLITYWTTRKRKYAIATCLAFSLIIVLWLIARFLPSDRKDIENAINDIAAGVRNRSTDQVFANIAKSFKYRIYNKESFRQRTESHIRDGDVSDILIRDFDVKEVSRTTKKAEVEFMTKPLGITTSDAAFFICRATFVLEDDGKWRMQTFELFKPIGDGNRPFDIPGL